MFSGLRIWWSPWKKFSRSKMVLSYFCAYQGLLACLHSFAKGHLEQILLSSILVWWRSALEDWMIASALACSRLNKTSFTCWLGIECSWCASAILWAGDTAKLQRMVPDCSWFWSLRSWRVRIPWLRGAGASWDGRERKACALNNTYIKL